MPVSEWLRGQLQANAEGFEWAVEQVPPERRNATPPGPLGEWSATRHLFHLLYYEREMALPGMRQWLGAPRPDVEDEDEDLAWDGDPDLESLLAGFRQVRAEQVALLAEFDPPAWEEVRPTIWGEGPLRWVVSKTYQHGAQHTSDVLQIALFWDVFAIRLREDGG